MTDFIFLLMVTFGVLGILLFLVKNVAHYRNDLLQGKRRENYTFVRCEPPATDSHPGFTGSRDTHNLLPELLVIMNGKFKITPLASAFPFN